MDRKSAVQVPEVRGIDLEFRPRFYFWPLGLETQLLARIKGAERKAVLKTLIQARRLAKFPTSSRSRR